MELQKVKAVLFDLDGTLLDTIRDIGTCVNDVMCRYGYPMRPLEEYKALVGYGARNLVRSCLPEGASEEEIQKVFDAYVPHYREHYARLTEPFPGIPQFLEALRQNGYQIGLITNKTQPTAERIIGKFFPGIPFDLLWGNNGVRPLKPSRESGELACRELGRWAEEILFVGDGDTDIEFAVNCGFFPCGVTWGYRDPDILLRCGAELMIDSIEELAARLFAGKKIS